MESILTAFSFILPNDLIYSFHRTPLIKSRFSSLWRALMKSLLRIRLVNFPCEIHPLRPFDYRLAPLSRRRMLEIPSGRQQTCFAHLRTNTFPIPLIQYSRWSVSPPGPSNPTMSEHRHLGLLLMHDIPNSKESAISSARPCPWPLQA